MSATAREQGWDWVRQQAERQKAIERPPEVRVISVVEVAFRRGEGIEGDPVRIVRGYWSFDGDLLAEHDAWRASNPIPDSSVEEGAPQ